MTERKAGLRRELGLRDLVLFNLAALLSTRWIGVAAHVGPGSLLLWVIAALLFLVPCAFVVSSLGRRYPDEGGLFVWTRAAFGDWHGFACAWMYYVNNLFWIPGVLIAVVGMVTVTANARWASLAESPAYVLPFTFAVLTLVVAANYVGLSVAKWVDNFGALGVYAILVLLLISAIFAAIRHGSQTQFDLTPAFNLDRLNFWSQMAIGLTGLELSPIMAGEIRNPRQAIFRATWLSTALVVLFYVLSTASILVLLPPEKVSPVVGLAEASQAALHILGWRWVPIAMGGLILLSVGGQLGTYIGASARLPFVLGVDNLLPSSFGALHPRFGTPHRSLVFLGIGSAVLLLVSQMGETLRGAYQISVDLTVISLFIPFLYIFAVAWKFGQRVSAACGLVVSSIAIAFSFLPTPDIKSPFWFEVKLIGGTVLLFAVARLMYVRYRSRVV